MQSFVSEPTNRVFSEEFSVEGLAVQFKRISEKIVRQDRFIIDKVFIMNIILNFNVRVHLLSVAKISVFQSIVQKTF